MKIFHKKHSVSLISSTSTVGIVCLVILYGGLCLSTFSGSLREPIDPLLSRVTIVGHNG